MVWSTSESWEQPGQGPEGPVGPVGPDGPDGVDGVITLVHVDLSHWISVEFLHGTLYTSM